MNELDGWISIRLVCRPEKETMYQNMVCYMDFEELLPTLKEWYPNILKVINTETNEIIYEI